MAHTKYDVFWYQTPASKLPPLQRRVAADAVIVGGGMAGLMCAQRLCEGGRSVVIVDKDFCGAGASGKSSGFITPDSEVELNPLIANYGPECAKKIWEFALSGVEAIRSNITELHIPCDYQVQDSLFVAGDESSVKYPRQEDEARCSLGYASRFYPSAELPRIIGSNAYAAAVRYPQTFGINSYQYCQGLKQALLDSGVAIFESTPVISLRSGAIDTPQGAVIAPHVIVTADRFIPGLGALRTEIYHVQTFLGITAPLDPATVSAIFPEEKMMVWDTQLIYNYFRITGDNRLLFGGSGLRFSYARQPATRLAGIERGFLNYLRTNFPALRTEFEYLWPGMIGVSKDLLPVMGPDATRPGVWYTGAAAGLPWAAALGRYAAEKVLCQRDEFDKLFSFNRRFAVGPRVQRLIGTPLTFALSHGLTKLKNAR